MRLTTGTSWRDETCLTHSKVVSMISTVSWHGFASSTALLYMWHLYWVIHSQMLTIQATIYAYKKHWHNIVDILLFANLSCTTKETSKIQSYQLEIDVLSVVKTFLVYLPQVYVVWFYATSYLSCYVEIVSQRKNSVNMIMYTSCGWLQGDQHFI